MQNDLRGGAHIPSKPGHAYLLSPPVKIGTGAEASQFKFTLRWFMSNCSENENLLKFPRGEVYDMLIVKTEKKLGSPNSFRRYDKGNMRPPPPPPPPPYGAILTLLRVTGTIAVAQPLFNNDLTKDVYLVIIYKKTWYFSETNTIDVHCRGAKMYFPIFSDMLFWEACAKNVKYYKL
jgi:hypothetical protein